MAFAPKSLSGFSAKRVSWGTVETIPRSMPGTSGAPYTPPVATMTASGFMARTKSGVTVVLVLMVSPGVFLA